MASFTYGPRGCVSRKDRPRHLPSELTRVAYCPILGHPSASDTRGARGTAIPDKDHGVGGALAVVLLCAGLGCTHGVMSWKEYSRTTHPVPYVIGVEAGHGALLYFGAQHIGEARGTPRHPEVDQIVSEWEQFRPTLVFSEGRSTIGRDSPSLEAAARVGEGGVLRFLAARDAVPTRSIEPPLEEEVHALREWFSLEQIKVYYVLRCVSQRCTGPGTPEDQAARWLQREGERPELAGTPQTIEDFENSTRRLLPKLDWRTVTVGFLDPTKGFLDPKSEGGETFLQGVARRTSDVRDEYMVATLVASVREGERVFAVVGASHVVMQDPALRGALRKAKI